MVDREDRSTFMRGVDVNGGADEGYLSDGLQSRLANGLRIIKITNSQSMRIKTSYRNNKVRR